MKLTGDVEILEGLPILYVKSLDAIVCSDLHLGYEGVMAAKGVFLPKTNLRKIEESVGKALVARPAKRIVIDGDIKNEFSDVALEEFNEFRELMLFLRSKGIEEIILVKGNHDNFIDRYREALSIRIYSQEAMLGKYLFFHGEELPKGQGGSMLVMGHVHPSIGVYNKLGVKERLRCFLYGKLADGRPIIILPAMNYFAEGVEANMGDLSDLSPVFSRMLDVNGMRALCIGEGETLDFGKISGLRYR